MAVSPLVVPVHAVVVAFKSSPDLMVSLAMMDSDNLMVVVMVVVSEWWHAVMVVSYLVADKDVAQMESLRLLVSLENLSLVVGSLGIARS